MNYIPFIIYLQSVTFQNRLFIHWKEVPFNLLLTFTTGLSDLYNKFVLNFRKIYFLSIRV